MRSFYPEKSIAILLIIININILMVLPCYDPILSKYDQKAYQGTISPSNFEIHNVILNFRTIPKLLYDQTRFASLLLLNDNETITQDLIVRRIKGHDYFRKVDTCVFVRLFETIGRR